MWLYLVQGIGYGFAASTQPGPLQTYLISQTIARGWKKTLPAVFAPLLSDGPIIAICLLVLSQVPIWFQRFLYIAGGIFILYLTYGAYQAWKNFDIEAAIGSSSQQSLIKAALTNMFNPGPYIFWTLITGPILIKGWRETPLHGIALLLGFYLTLIGGFAAMVLIFGTTAKLGPKVNRALLGISAIALLGFGIYQLWLGIKG